LYIKNFKVYIFIVIADIYIYNMVTIDIVPALRDNYMYLISDPVTKIAAVVDPVEPEQLIAKAAERGVEIQSVLTTHSHWDHAGGNNKIKGLVSTLTEIYGGVGDGVEACSKEVDHGDVITVGNIKVTVLATPCHTQGHISFFIDQQENVEQPAVFSGDTMFVGGCGNFNSGTPEQMYHSMCKVLGKLPPKTLVYCGHEYTKRNLAFAAYAEPGNLKIFNKIEWCNKVQCTVPSTIESELETNPFVRVHVPTIQQFTKETNPVQCLFRVRKMKDEWGKTH
jgi:hydroxyacylglutathione hydrolase